MKIVADLHLHSKYSRAVSFNMTLENMAIWAAKKGINILATSDWTHPLWFVELSQKLEEDGSGLLKLKTTGYSLQSTEQSEISNSVVSRQSALDKQEVRFLLSCEISSIYSQEGKVRRIHNLIFVPILETANKINKELQTRGANLRADGRPIIGLSSKNLAELVLEIDERALIIPAHIWTPWFSLYGSNSGFDSIDQCFGDMSKYIYGIETGLSSDPAMNWRIAELDSRTILSFSDAHSLPKMAREATVFELEDVNYDCLYKAIRSSSEIGKNRVAFTIEFFPEEGKYHFTGHRNCNVSYSPKDTNGKLCPVCGKPLTIGVMQRIEDLATRSEQDVVIAKDDLGFVKSQSLNRPAYKMLVPLIEILAEALSAGQNTKTVLDEYDKLINSFGSELSVLIKTPLGELEKITNNRVVEAILKVRNGEIVIEPGFDGVFGTVKIWQDDKGVVKEEDDQSQLTLL